jgi:hypothetical protein
MDPVEIGFFSSLVEESSKVDESVGRFINGAKRNPTMMFGQAGITLNEMCDLDVAAHSGLEGLATVTAIQVKLSEQENKVLPTLVARQAAAILRLLSHLANLGGGGAAPMAIAADLPGGAPASRTAACC